MPGTPSAIGPKKDIVGTWAKLARDRGLRFGVTNHSAHAWHWFQTAYGYDPEGPRAGVRYDAFRLKKEDGKGKWWEGLDPQELYTGPNIVMPDGITTIKDANAWHAEHDRKWTEEPPANNPDFVDRWFLRCQDLIDKYQPDLLYFDDTELPLGQAGLDIAAHFYNANIHRRGRLEAVLTSKGLRPGSSRDDGARHRARTRRPDPAGGLADRHVHRRLALPAGDLRGAPVQVRRHHHQDARGHRQQERKPAPEHPAARRRHHR